MFERLYIYLLRTLKVRSSLTHICQQYADRNPTEFGLLTGAVGAGLTGLILSVGGPVAWIVVVGAALLYGHIFWGGYRFKG